MAEKALGRRWNASASGDMGVEEGKKKRKSPGQAGIKRPRQAMASAAAGGVGAGDDEDAGGAAAAAGGGGSGGGAMYQRSQFTGVCRNGNRWLARISYGGKKYSLGGFDTEREAGKSPILYTYM